MKAIYGNILETKIPCFLLHKNQYVQYLSKYPSIYNLRCQHKVMYLMFQALYMLNWYFFLEISQLKISFWIICFLVDWFPCKSPVVYIILSIVAQINTDFIFFQQQHFQHIRYWGHMHDITRSLIWHSADATYAT